MNNTKRSKMRLEISRLNIELELQIATNSKTLPPPAEFREWINITLWQRVDTAELTIRIVDQEESAKLNWQYRKKKGATNVLSFPYETPPGTSSHLFGDIVLCAPVIEQEAKQYHKLLLAHWAHMVIHGTLHLLGYDHVKAQEAVEMESLETEILFRFNFPPPYGETFVS